MNEFIKKYRIDAQMDLGKLKRKIDELKVNFRSTIWTDQRSMVDAANEIWQYENALKNSLEIHKLITDNLGEA